MVPQQASLPARTWRDRWQAFRQNQTFHLVAGVTLGVTILLLLRLPVTEFIELKLYDLKFWYRGGRTPAPEIVLVAIDEESVKKVGRWPWSREVMAQLLSRMKEAEARVIGMDIIFAERQETAALTTLKRLERDLTRKNAATPEILALLAEGKRRADVDRHLAQIIGQGSPTVLGFFFVKVGGRAMSLKIGAPLGPKIIQASAYNMVRWLDQQPERLPLMSAEGAEVNLPEIAENAAGGGYFNMIPDRDGTVRWVPLALAYGPDIFAPMTLITLQQYRDKVPLGITLSHLGVKEVRLGREKIPVDRFGRLFINFLGPPGLFPVYSAAKVLDGSLPPKALKDKLVLLGATAVGIYDLRVTPFSGICPGLEIQATVLDNILRRDFIRTPANPFLSTLSIVLAIGLIFGFLLPRLSAIGAIAITLLLAQGYLGLNYLAFSWYGLHLEVFYPLLEVAGVYTGITLQRFLAEERERVRIKKAFQSYVAPEVVQQIIRHPEKLRLGGERRELSILFSDIRGFTSLSEDMAPEALVEVLHEFLDPMSEIIVKHGGTLDKYIGDAIMALFGAPLDLPDHSRRACRTALEMVQRLKVLDQEWIGRGRPPLKIGIGINSGWVAVGNMGSSRLFDYTAIGDNVNLASRLEGLNKYYGTEILVSAATIGHLDNGLILREVDLVKVKGREQAVAIYELLGEGAPDRKLARFLELYNQALHLFRERRFEEAQEAFQEALHLEPNDGPCFHYMQVIQKLKEQPPGPEWNGVTTMVEK
ncbi:MAG: CHASE2 domain-containing protein [Desulfobaccales bacterium]